jgi:hypothetical protein
VARVMKKWGLLDAGDLLRARRELTIAPHRAFC